MVIQLDELALNTHSSNHNALNILHESLHAKLIAEVGSTDFKELYGKYEGWGLGIDKEQAKVMLDKYFEELATGLKEFDESQGNYQSIELYKKAVRYDLIYEIYEDYSSQDDYYNGYLPIIIKSSINCN